MLFNQKAIGALLLCAALFPAAPAAASQTAYQYDARGRLVGVIQSGSAAYEARYGYDKADNRLSRTVTGGGAALVIVPVRGGYRVIPIQRE